MSRWFANVPSWVVASLVTAILFAIYQLLLRRLFAGPPLLLVTAYVMLTGSILLFALHLAFSENKSILLSGRLALSVVVTGVFLALGNYSINLSFRLGASQLGFTA